MFSKKTHTHTNVSGSAPFSRSKGLNINFSFICFGHYIHPARAITRARASIIFDRILWY